MIARSMLLVLASTLGIAIAGDWHYAAGFSAWHTTMDHQADSKSVMEKAYDTCREYEGSTQITASSGVCISHCVSFIFQSFGAAFGGGYIVDAVASGIVDAGETQSSSPSRVRRDRSDKHQQALLDHFNRQSKPHDLRATHIVTSHIHPLDGLAIRMNVHGDHSTMHLHTNGTHGMILFDEDTELQRRDFLDTGGLYFKFSGMNGFKAQVHSINAPSADTWGTDIGDFVKHWAGIDVKNEPILKQSDAWRFEACNEKKTATFFYGMLSAEAGKTGNSYESINPPGCH